MDARTTKSGQRLLKLRNPWGTPKEGLWTGAWSDGSKEWTAETLQELGHKFGSDSVFWISYKDVLRKFQYFDRTRLFHNQPDWFISQEWTSLDVPWRTDYQEKFRITLTESSPVVVVLSQLDDRYFRGLEGQYQYTLQFRLHELGSRDPEDYIVRSHGNYLMTRSVSVELQSLKSGKYSVFVKVFATRDLSKSSPEDIVKKFCREKKHNEKLLQVGHAYDVAHSKGSKHLNRDIKAQRVRERKTKKDFIKAAEKRKLKELELVQNAAIPEVIQTTLNPIPPNMPLETPTTGEDPAQQELEPAAQQISPSPLPGSEQIRHEDVQNTRSLAITTENLDLHTQRADPSDRALVSQVQDSGDDSSSEEAFSRRKRHGNEDRGWYNADPYETDDENDAKPWNAVCVIGFKVYSKDPGLTIKIVPSSRGKEAAMDPDDIQIDAVEDVKWTDPKGKKKTNFSERTSPVSPPLPPPAPESQEKGKERQEVPVSPKTKSIRTRDTVFTGLDDI